MTEPTPVPDDPGEGLRTSSAPGSGARVDNARNSGVRTAVAAGPCTPPAREQRNGQVNGTHRNGTHLPGPATKVNGTRVNGSPTTTNGSAVRGEASVHNA